jgi:hypothetical protein
MEPQEANERRTPILTLAHGDPVAAELTLAIWGGDLDTLRSLITARPELVTVA